ncbi:MAG: dTMP kinase [Elusimicrobia bacterium RIFOXYA2_FULL_50_26]|nr:MAG: dTMP kinase [Elusimicrobia bacterium RIFOXYA2_FULL_50_26]OGS23509.1 MAG: dTMP kinase [Elusimicrobia bacterium RIFOXYB2_FULL_50_12]
MRKSFFISLEGPEGSGKSTQCALLTRLLTDNGYGVVATREPGGTAVAEALRRILLAPGRDIAPLTELFLYEASRAQHMAEIILPALRNGKIVICDRFTDATIAYQGYGRKLDKNVIRQLNNIATQQRIPNLTIILDVPVETGLRRARRLAKDSAAGGDRIERESAAFHRRVRRGYVEIARGEPERVKVVRARDTIEKTHAAIVKIIGTVLNLNVI